MSGIPVDNFTGAAMRPAARYITDADRTEIENQVYHKPFGDQAARYACINADMQQMLTTIYSYSPDSKEREMAIHYLKLARMSANAAIAMHEKEEGSLG